MPLNPSNVTSYRGKGKLMSGNSDKEPKDQKEVSNMLKLKSDTGNEALVQKNFGDNNSSMAKKIELENSVKAQGK